MQGILGQARAVTALQKQLQTDRLHHAQLFHGPAGVGKFTTAMAMAKVVLCHEPQTTLTGEVEACGSCKSCHLLRDRGQPPENEGNDTQGAAGSGGALGSLHPDLHIVVKELALYSDNKQMRDRKLLRIPVEVVREALIEPAYRGSQLGHGKVFIVDEAELLNAEGQNALLKTLEEPPGGGGGGGGGGTTIVLVTSSEERLLPTIRSRCQRTAFVPLPDEAVTRWLSVYAPDVRRDQEKGGEAGADWLVRFASGSIGRAKLAVDYDLIEWARAVLPPLRAMGKGRVTQDAAELGGRMAELIGELAERWVKAHDHASKDAANRLAAGLMGALVADEARAQVAELAGGVSPDDPMGAEAVLEPWLGVIDVTAEAQALLERNVNLALVCEDLALRVGGSLVRAA